jgi:hypothetical protein
MRELYILMLSLHGLIRGNDLELGSDADTGGQTLYVVELARSLANQRQVGKLDLLTRRVEDPAVSSDYARSEEMLGEVATGWIVRFLRHLAALQLLEMGRSRALSEGVPRSEDRAGAGMPQLRLCYVEVSTSRCGLASFCGRHCSALAVASFRVVAPCPAKTAHSTPSNCRI